MYEIIIGRNESDRKKYGVKGTILLGKHYVKMGQTTSLSNKIYMDVTRSHVVFICGKRGGGKSYTMGVIAEGVSDLPDEIKSNISVIILDTMGIYWTMKYPNRKDKLLLDEWELEDKGLDIKIYTPTGYYDQYKEKGIPTDKPFAIRVADLDPYDWCMTLGFDQYSAHGILIERTIRRLKKTGKSFAIEHILNLVEKDKRCDEIVRDAVINKFNSANEWGLFDRKGTSINELAKGGQVTVLDVSCYATTSGASGLRALVIGLVAQKLFLQRMIARKDEEYQSINKSMHYFEAEDGEGVKMPLVWLVIDEAHEFLPNEGKTIASDPLITILREGRQPGISLILATQQPGKIHTDVMTQSDTVLSHRLTAKIDTEALGMLMQSYMREGLDKYLDQLPRVSGAGIILDDSNERMYPMRVRPRFTWHGGESPTAMKEDDKKFKF
ncbi:ATP-binding protein [Candidatus Woesearchaeota archaeon]|nr:ATP-binding protein [Candidatus Woesearchaeota archaeon]